MGDDLGCNNMQKHGEREREREKSCKITNMIRLKGSERRTFIFIFRLNIVLRDSYQPDETVMELRNGNKTFQTTMSKALIEFY